MQSSEDAKDEFCNRPSPFDIFRYFIAKSLLLDNHSTNTVKHLGQQIRKAWAQLNESEEKWLFKKMFMDNKVTDSEQVADLVQRSISTLRIEKAKQHEKEEKRASKEKNVGDSRLRNSEGDEVNASKSKKRNDGSAVRSRHNLKNGKSLKKLKQAQNKRILNESQDSKSKSRERSNRKASSEEQSRDGSVKGRRHTRGMARRSNSKRRHSKESKISKESGPNRYVKLRNKLNKDSSRQKSKPAHRGRGGRSQRGLSKKESEDEVDEPQRKKVYQTPSRRKMVSASSQSPRESPKQRLTRSALKKRLNQSQSISRSNAISKSQSKSRHASKSAHKKSKKSKKRQELQSEPEESQPQHIQTRSQRRFTPKFRSQSKGRRK